MPAGWLIVSNSSFRNFHTDSELLRTYHCQCIDLFPIQYFSCTVSEKTNWTISVTVRGMVTRAPSEPDALALFTQSAGYELHQSAYGLAQTFGLADLVTKEEAPAETP